MSFDLPLHISHSLLITTGTQVSVRHAERIPSMGAMLVISNHRSFLDLPLVMNALGRSVRFACHHYMSQVPVLKEIVSTLGCVPLDAPGQRRQVFFEQAIDLLQAYQPVGIFPEGARPMVQATNPNELSQFHRGFAHLALRVPVQKLAILPVAISAIEETISPMAPLKLFSLFDPSEPLFDQPGWHPSVNYHRVNLSVGSPIWITDSLREQYQGKQAGRLAKVLTRSCYGEIKNLLREGFA
ncbi:lysophospholipid acyltransferase family protein [Leptolyngbya sp. Heron Island J]|uniref:lysophospholipid acyltransferase family protein n=1 Tax=Leptolyngbya sp. Heron Island J TaxID=1385935 RepID=UPI00040460C4|nr:1-acyl-sn-glycerol-3-phosphate acyltransferase [Leptolyngbya sp. Heron Island J]